ncbi:Uncharacterised protein [Klebsiella variicola]|nr:hypothetical protein AI2651V1_2992 [Klebsiella pneumoniae]STV52350.1 Uncharacterised protein [Klebsiella pneumoniae subsp. pneumoniae]SXE84565.1 Uncharacterised protein [Klebsiella variicola]CAH3566439.1 hypothetical protein AI2651V1_2992 [Klebsiella pneumoniae]SXF16278.1 Uncharacterised protein [Klebsiella variicola]
MFFTHGFQINHNVNIINWLIFLLIMMTGFNIYRIRLMNNFICFFFLVNLARNVNKTFNGKYSVPNF